MDVPEPGWEAAAADGRVAAALEPNALEAQTDAKHIRPRAQKWL
jgi:hypothetical protein